MFSMRWEDLSAPEDLTNTNGALTVRLTRNADLPAHGGDARGLREFRVMSRRTCVRMVV